MICGGIFLLFSQEQMFADDLENEVRYTTLKYNRSIKWGKWLSHLSNGIYNYS